jgi:hypothetical protein
MRKDFDSLISYKNEGAINNSSRGCKYIFLMTMIHINKSRGNIIVPKKFIVLVVGRFGRFGIQREDDGGKMSVDV